MVKKNKLKENKKEIDETLKKLKELAEKINLKAELPEKIPKIIRHENKKEEESDEEANEQEEQGQSNDDFDEDFGESEGFFPRSRLEAMMSTGMPKKTAGEKAEEKEDKEKGEEKENYSNKEEEENEDYEGGRRGGRAPHFERLPSAEDIHMKRRGVGARFLDFSEMPEEMRSVRMAEEAREADIIAKEGKEAKIKEKAIETGAKKKYEKLSSDKKLEARELLEGKVKQYSAEKAE